MMIATLDVRADREVDVPLERLWDAFVEPQLVKLWWGPAGFSCPLANMDVRLGGVSLLGMKAPPEYGGGVTYTTWSYTDVDPGVRLEYDVRFSTSEGLTISPAEAGIGAGVPEEVPHVVTFDSLGPNRSRVSFLESGYTLLEQRDMSELRLVQCLDKLEDALSR
jgi:uncharacterized protein YndB with AHSA1/START domain